MASGKVGDMSAKPVNFKKRTVAGQCRAMRCKVREPETLYEFETDDPKTGTALLCEGHWRRADENKTDPAPVGPTAEAPAVVELTTASGAQVASVTEHTTASGAQVASVARAPAGAQSYATHAPAPDVTLADIQAAHDATVPAPGEHTAVVVQHGPVMAIVNPIRDEYTGIAAQLVGMVIGSQEQVDMAGELLKQIKGKLKTLKAQRLDITRPVSYTHLTLPTKRTW